MDLINGKNAQFIRSFNCNKFFKKINYLEINEAISSLYVSPDGLILQGGSYGNLYVWSEWQQLI